MPGEPKKPVKRVTTWALSLVAFLMLAVPSQGTQASEIVKLTRLVLTGKRVSESSVPAKPTQAPTSSVTRLPAVSVDGLHMEDGPTQVAGQLRAGIRPS